MRSSGAKIVLSASDLTGHLNCRHLTALDVEVARGTRAKPKVWDPVLELLAERGALHEASYRRSPSGERLECRQVEWDRA